ncbi:polyhydroxyalkanoate depolymerase [Candidatus Colwellia aromaticivorans]|uniref:polyhydroxyalkanoate depolymerase n=1 Tax=Candidatus Colwellia aromaticivorans TaxID=2267621 RepID=UPI000DF3ED79|nr:polyhydroxyalkanoate depolymerase [Candidatus Colwellia aromaticivorans]
MMYQSYDLYSRSAEMMNGFIALGQTLINNPYNPYAKTFLGKSISAGLDSAFHHTKVYDKQPFDIKTTTIDGETVNIDEQVILKKPFCNLIHFKQDTKVQQPKLFVVAPLSGHHATLLKATIERLIADHDVYITDWLDAKNVPLSEGEFNFDDYVTYVVDFMKEIGENTHVLAVCQPAVQALIATAVLAKEKDPATPKSLTIVAGPIDTSINPNELNKYANSKDLSWFENNVVMTVPNRYPGAGRKVYPGFIQLSSFIAMNMESHIKKHKDYFGDVFHGKEEESTSHRNFYDEYLSVLDLNGEFYLETLDRVFINHDLANGKMTYHGELVDLSVITDTALHTIEGQNDDICSIGQTQAAHALCSGIPDENKLDQVFEGVGHFGTFSGSAFRNRIAPSIADFIQKHN